MPTLIVSNGSKWAGESPDDIDTLCTRLETYTLHPSFEVYGGFLCEAEPGIMSALNDRADWCPAWRQGVLIETDGSTFQRGTMHAFGNFWDLSGVFSIYTDDPSVIDRLSRLIRANRATVAYKEARDEHRAYIAAREAEAKRSQDSRRARAR